MDRHEWGDIVGDGGLTIEDDLRWTLFQAERCVETLLREHKDEGRPLDSDLLHINKWRVHDCHVALAALWARNPRRASDIE